MMRPCSKTMIQSLLRTVERRCAMTKVVRCLLYTSKMGVQGAALATVISQFAAACWTLRFLTGKKATIRLDKNYLKLKTDRVKKILVLGLSGFTMSVTNSLVQMVCNINLAMYGGDMYIAAMTIINSVREVIHMPVSGVGNGAQPVSYTHLDVYKRQGIHCGLSFMI